jgi:hypothetical protein
LKPIAIAITDRQPNYRSFTIVTFQFIKNKSLKTKFLFLILFVSIFAQQYTNKLDKIKQQDLKGDLYELAGDAFYGRRRGGELGEIASFWVVQRGREAGLKPAGEDGTYQFFNLKRSRMATGRLPA